MSVRECTSCCLRMIRSRLRAAGGCFISLFAMSCQHTVYIAIISLQEATHAFPEAVTLISIVDKDKLMHFQYCPAQVLGGITSF